MKPRHILQLTFGYAGPPSSKSSNKFSLVDPSIYDKLLTDTDRKPIKLRVKRTPAKQNDPGRWHEENQVTSSQPEKEIPAPSSPLVSQVDDKIAAAFPSGKPFEDVADIVQCKHCKKPVLKHAAPEHIRSCLRKKQEKLLKKKEAKEAKDAALRKERNGGVSPAGSDDENGGKRARKTAVDGDGAQKNLKAGKKRKAEDDGKGGSAKKKSKKDDPKAKKPAKGPVDVEKQCGVPLPNGALCARSLTCKSHSMGAKRAVPGRSAPYDVLLAQYQKKNQAKQQRMFIHSSTIIYVDILTLL
jgi:SAGA-associated factor 73